MARAIIPTDINPAPTLANSTLFNKSNLTTAAKIKGQTNTHNKNKIKTTKLSPTQQHETSRQATRPETAYKTQTENPKTSTID